MTAKQTERQDTLHLRLPVARQYTRATLMAHAATAAAWQGAHGELRYCGVATDVEGLPDGITVHAFECDRTR